MNGGDDKTAVKCRKLTAMGLRQREQITIGSLRRTQQASRINFSFVQQTDVIAPKYMPVERTHGPQQGRHSRLDFPANWGS